jgi:hypothetical protein
VAAGVFDGDGRLDLLATNWGRNTKYDRHRQPPLRLYYGDWLGHDQVALLEAYYDPARQNYVPATSLDVLRITASALAARFPSFAAYARASIEEVIGQLETPAPYLEAN